MKNVSHENAKNTTSKDSWKIESRTKINSVGINLCMHIGVLPPDQLKAQDYSKLECWINPETYNLPQKAGEIIGNKLQSQFENIQPKAKYKLAIDPSLEDTKKQLVSLRKHAKSDRALFYYSGHGVPKPTINGELWVFNRQFTQYVPLSIYEIISLIGTPSVFIFDMPACLNVTSHFEQRIIPETNSIDGEHFPVIYMASNKSYDQLPSGNSIPNDLLTCCLTTPIEMSVYWFYLKKANKLPSFLAADALKFSKSVPGKLSDRKSPLGELNWILTCITDSIAWEVLPNSSFKILYRHDLLLSSLFRNFLLANKIMKYFGASPSSYPSIPDTSAHPLWQWWEYVLDRFLSRISDAGSPQPTELDANFFETQLAHIQSLAKNPVENSIDVINYLPCLLQILLSQNCRTQSLQIFRDVFAADTIFAHKSMHVGVYPYLLKLTQTSCSETKEILADVWRHLFRALPSIKEELLKEHIYKYFYDCCANNTSKNSNLKIKVLKFFEEFFADYPTAINICYEGGFLDIIFELLRNSNYVCYVLPIIESFMKFNFNAFLDLYPLLKNCLKTFLIHKNPQNCAFEIRNKVLIFAKSYLEILCKSYSLESIEFSSGICLNSVVECTLDCDPVIRFNALRCIIVIADAFYEKMVEKASFFNVTNSENFPYKENSEDIFCLFLKVILILSADYDREISKLANGFLDSVAESLIYNEKINSNEIETYEAVAEKMKSVSLKPTIKPIHKSEAKMLPNIHIKDRKIHKLSNYNSLVTNSPLLGVQVMSAEQHSFSLVAFHSSAPILISLNGNGVIRAWNYCLKMFCLKEIVVSTQVSTNAVKMFSFLDDYVVLVTTDGVFIVYSFENPQSEPLCIRSSNDLLQCEIINNEFEGLICSKSDASLQVVSIYNRQQTFFTEEETIPLKLEKNILMTISKNGSKITSHDFYDESKTTTVDCAAAAEILAQNLDEIVRGNCLPDGSVTLFR